jgi:hypothetical protein
MLKMKYRPRIYYTDAQKELMWDRWQKGDSQGKIAQLFDRGHSSIARILMQSVGIRPPKKTRAKRALSLAEREEISRGFVAGRSFRSIAVSLNRAPSTVSWEISRNGGRQHYRANVADKAAWDRATSYPGNSTSHSPGIVAKRWQITNASPWTQISRFTFVIQRVPGSVAPTKTPTACSGSTFQRE